MRKPTLTAMLFFAIAMSVIGGYGTYASVRMVSQELQQGFVTVPAPRFSAWRPSRTYTEATTPVRFYAVVASPPALVASVLCLACVAWLRVLVWLVGGQSAEPAGTLSRLVRALVYTAAMAGAFSLLGIGLVPAFGV